MDCVSTSVHKRPAPPTSVRIWRGDRMRIETDSLQITSGVRHGLTLGSPISFSIQNRDWSNWQDAMSMEPAAEDTDTRSVTLPRPGHADLPGALKYQTHDVRDILERASARETTVRVAAGALCRLFLSHFGINISSHTLGIGAETSVGRNSKILKAIKSSRLILNRRYAVWIRRRHSA